MKCVSQTLLPLLLILLASISSAQVVQPSDQQLDALHGRIQAHMEKENIPGALVALVSRGEIIHAATYGLANVEHSVKVTQDSVFEIGSISKQFVTAVVMQLVEEGALGIDDPIQNFISDIPSEWLGVTVRQLMNHTSGIPDYELIASYDIYGERLTPEQVIRIAHSRPMDFVPGTGWFYSNTGYYLLSMIVERVAGTPLNQVLRARIFDPAGMPNSRLADPEAIIAQRAAGYWVNQNGELINRRPTETSSTLGAGGILSTLQDLVAWDEVLYGEQILSDEAKQAMWEPTPQPDGTAVEYGFGWVVSDYDGMRRVGHSGQVAGFSAQFQRFIDEELTVIMFINRYEASSGPIWRDTLHTFVPSLGAL